MFYILVWVLVAICGCFYRDQPSDYSILCGLIALFTLPLLIGVIAAGSGVVPQLEEKYQYICWMQKQNFTSEELKLKLHSEIVEYNKCLREHKLLKKSKLGFWFSYAFAVSKEILSLPEIKEE